MVLDYADYSVGLIGNSHFFGCVVCAVIKSSPFPDRSTKYYSTSVQCTIATHIFLYLFGVQLYPLWSTRVL